MTLSYFSDTKKLYIVLDKNHDDSILANLVVQSQSLKLTHNASLIRGVSVTKESSDPSLDFVSRYFAPWNGIDEDPVNGSSHTNLTPYWSHKLDKAKLTAKMLSKRTGVLKLEAHTDYTSIGGTAVIISQGDLLV